MSPRTRERALAAFLWCVGLVGLTALVPAAMPRTWMGIVHAWCGLGPLPEQPIVGYLARSTSLLYAFRGSVMCLAATDVVRYRRLIRLIAWTSVLFGLGLLWVDHSEGLPSVWARTEWLIVCGTGAAILVLMGAGDGGVPRSHE